ncbi:MAG: hypothetical protein ACLURP_04570 [Ruminococcus sp.]
MLKPFTEHGYPPRPRKSIPSVLNRAEAAAGITEEINTYTGWKQLGYEVLHGSKALFNCCLIWGSRGDGATYKASFFGESQVQPI